MLIFVTMPTISVCSIFSAGCCESGLCDEVTEYSPIPRFKAFSDWILKAMTLGNLEEIFPAASREHAPLFKDPAIHPPAANYFLYNARYYWLMVR